MWVYLPKSLCYLSFFLFSHTSCDRKWSRSENKRWTFIFSFHFFFFSPFFNKNTPMYKSFLLLHSSSHYLYQFPFSSMKQKLTKNRIRFSDLTTTMLKHYFASFLCLTVHVNIITILEEYSLLTQYLIFYI